MNLLGGAVSQTMSSWFIINPITYLLVDRCAGFGWRTGQLANTYRLLGTMKKKVLQASLRETSDWAHMGSAIFAKSRDTSSA